VEPLKHEGKGDWNSPLLRSEISGCPKITCPRTIEFTVPMDNQYHLIGLQNDHGEETVSQRFLICHVFSLIFDMVGGKLAAT
jgi:hypothetical protein